MLLLLAGMGWLFRDQLLTAAGSYLVESDKTESADAIVVFGGDEFGNRITTAAELQKQGLAPFVVVSGPPTLLGHESETMIEFARRKGYDPAIFHRADHELNSTRKEAIFFDQYCKEHNLRKILLVTSNYHTKRAAKLMRAASPRLDVIVVAASDPFFTPSTWWKTRNGEKTFLYEWLKTIATALGK